MSGCRALGRGQAMGLALVACRQGAAEVCGVKAGRGPSPEAVRGRP